MNPHRELTPHWERFKRSHRAALREVHRSFRYKSTAIRQFRQSQGMKWDQAARNEWNIALVNVLGADYRLEWIGDTNSPMCIVNGVMMFI